MADAPGGEDPGLAVMAHGLLNSMAVIVGAMTTLRDQPALDDAARRFLLERSLAHTELVAAMLKDLAQGLPLGATAILEEIDLRSARRRRVGADRL
jgi:hypothetical protein